MLKLLMFITLTTSAVSEGTSSDRTVCINMVANVYFHSVLVLILINIWVSVFGNLNLDWSWCQLWWDQSWKLKKKATGWCTVVYVMTRMINSGLKTQNHLKDLQNEEPPLRIYYLGDSWRRLWDERWNIFKLSRLPWIAWLRTYKTHDETGFPHPERIIKETQL